MLILSVFLGALVGIVMGLTGAGGGILAIPLLVFGMHITILEASPAALLAVGTAAAVGAFFGLKANLVRHRATLLIAGSGILMAPLGVWFAHTIDIRLMSLLFAGILGWVAYKTIHEIYGQYSKVQLEPAPPCVLNHLSGRFIWTNSCARALSLSGAIAGILSGLLGVGGGFVMVPTLQKYTDLATHSIVPTSLAVISLVSLASVATSFTAGNFDLKLALPFAAGSIAGMGAASLLRPRIGQKYLKTAFGLICFVVAVAMIIKSL